MLTVGYCTMQIRRSPRSVKLACNTQGLSHFSGTYFFNEFLRLLHIRNFLAGRIHYPRHCRDYSISQLLLALVYVILLGLDRIETASLLRPDTTFHYLTGLPSFPDPQTLRRFLLNAPAHLRQELHRINDRLLQNVIHLPEQDGPRGHSLNAPGALVIAEEEQLVLYDWAAARAAELILDVFTYSR